MRKGSGDGGKRGWFCDVDPVAFTFEAGFGELAQDVEDSRVGTGLIGDLVVQLCGVEAEQARSWSFVGIALVLRGLSLCSFAFTRIEKQLN